MNLAFVALAALTALPACVPHCDTPSDCIGGNVCAADGQCRAPTDVSTAVVTWTIAGAVASATTCPRPSLRVGFVTGLGRYQDEIIFAPVPCVEGKFTLINVPPYNEVELGYDIGDDFARAQFTAPGSGGSTAFDLPAE
jgi:hypothetical protein